MGKSNLDSFLDAITPSVQCQYVSKSRLNDAPYDGCDEALPFFNLSDLWSSYDEWSAYGAGVSLRLPKGESVTQYYVPYLSAMQIYLRSGWNVCTYKRSLSEESDWSDVSDMRDTSSDYGTDNESDKAPSRWDGSSCPSSERNSSPSSKRNDQLGDLVFEYFERAPPYNRSPLVEKVRELETVSPHTLALNNHQLSPASWFAVAWYGNHCSKYHSVFLCIVSYTHRAFGFSVGIQFFESPRGLQCAI
ncbi:hypothetical protein KP509_02G016900 [Ceratopteris richardii]|uniref:Uncharacterized protein n=1 Tax=Ceratopteris richardii TaxID=49495 RepID=A0A8T2VAT3_CERRI|nr:hypothetical protein KP509_02G016900 [Ceratopteris richardii]